MISSRFPLESYGTKSTDAYSCTISIVFKNKSNKINLEIKSIPQPDEDGLFKLNGKNIVVVPIATCEELDKAEISCVGEQLYNFIEPRIDEIQSGPSLTKEQLSSLLPIDKWIKEFLDEANRPQGSPNRIFVRTIPVQYLDENNWLSQCEHLRSLIIDVPRGHQKIIAHGQLGRICPISTPEGPNIGIVRRIARGAIIHNRKIIIADKDPESNLSVSVSMIPFLEYDDCNRALMGSNMMRQWKSVNDPEPALVQTGNEPNNSKFWWGCNLLTAFISWGVGTLEDGIIISESCAKRFNIEGIIEPGDKISNRHGTKGVISQILPDDEMPHLQDGTSVELVFSFIGLHTRLNCGQLIEAVFGRIAHAEGKCVTIPPFKNLSVREIKSQLSGTGLPINGMEKLKMGKNGPDLKMPSTVGWVYWGITHHLARQKMQVFPAKNQKKQVNGHIVDEIEYWALRKANAFENIINLFNTCSIERKDSNLLWQKIAKNNIKQSTPPTPMFVDLKRRLNAGGINMEFDGKKAEFSLARPRGKVLKLDCPVPHPWLNGKEIAVVGAIEELKEFHSLKETNDRMKRIFESNSPAKLSTQSRKNLEKRAQEYFQALLQPKEGDMPIGFCFTGIPGRIPFANMQRNPIGQIMFRSKALFSGRTVITPALDFTIDRAGLPEEMAWSLYEPFVIQKTGNSQDVRKRTKKAAAKLDEIMAKSWIILDRKFSNSSVPMIAFHPMRIPGKAIQLHPLACALMNSDFDGDQIAVFLPVSSDAQKEAGKKLSISGHLERNPELISLLYPPMASLWGLAYLSLSKEGQKEINSMAGIDLIGSDGFVTKDSIINGLQQILKQKGTQKTLDIIEKLMHLGFKAAKH